MTHSPDADGRTISHEAIYRLIYPLPKGELANAGILLRSKQTQRMCRKPLGERTGGRAVGMASIDDRPESASDRRVPGSWEGDLIIGTGGQERRCDAGGTHQPVRADLRASGREKLMGWRIS